MRTADLARFDHVLADFSDIGLRPADLLSQLDAAEVLNIKPALLPQLSPKLGIPFTLVGRALIAPLNEVLAAARKTAWSAEIAFHLGTQVHHVGDILLARGIRRSATGWCRSHLIAEGILPPVPET